MAASPLFVGFKTRVVMQRKLCTMMMNGCETPFARNISGFCNLVANYRTPSSALRGGQNQPSPAVLGEYLWSCPSFPSPTSLHEDVFSSEAFPEGKIQPPRAWLGPWWDELWQRSSDSSHLPAVWPHSPPELFQDEQKEGVGDCGFAQQPWLWCWMVLE